MKNTRLFPLVVSEEKSPYPHRDCLLWSGELNACLCRSDIIPLRGKLKLKFMRRSGDEWTEGCCCVGSKAGWHSASESSHDLGNGMSIATTIQGGQATPLALHAADAHFNQALLQRTVT